MTTEQRQAVRGALLDAGFRKVGYCECHDDPKHYDQAQNGVYTEEWVASCDRTKIILEWDRKTQAPRKSRRTPHKCRFSRSKTSASVETCRCGAWRFTEHAGESIEEKK